MNIPTTGTHVRRVGTRSAIRIAMAAIGTVAALALPRSAMAQAVTAADSAAVLAATQTLLRSINTRDTSLAGPLLLPGGAFVSVREGSPAVTRVESHADFVQQLSTGSGRYLERIWAPRLTFEGSLAEVRAPYDFHIDGKFSHCGVDVFTLVKTAAGWRISGTAYTVQQTGCAPSPLGPPK